MKQTVDKPFQSRPRSSAEWAVVAVQLIVVLGLPLWLGTLSINQRILNSRWGLPLPLIVCGLGAFLEMRWAEAHDRPKTAKFYRTTAIFLLVFAATAFLITLVVVGQVTNALGPGWDKS